MSVTGVQFPLDSSGGRSTGNLAKDVLADALATADPSAPDRIRRIKDWRKGYIAPFTEMVQVGVHDADHWDGVARAALESLQSRMVGTHTVDGTMVETPMTDFLDVVVAPSTPGTETISGTAEPVRQLAIPYRGENLTGAALRDRLDRWVADGVVEPEEQQRFLAAVTGLAEIPAGGLGALNIVVPQLVLDKAPTIGGGIF